jgi:hypothetical protein
MPDLSSQVLPQIQKHRLQGLPPADDLVMPCYEGLSLVNLPGTVARLLDVPAFGEPPLDTLILDHLGGPYHKSHLFTGGCPGL